MSVTFSGSSRDYIHTAIYENKQIKFHYAEWTVKKELKFKKNSAFYVVSPWALTWDDENYYLVAYDAAAGIIKHYRVDKMRDTEILEAERKGEESFKNFDLAAFAKKTFGMYGGVDAEVTQGCGLSDRKMYGSSIKSICKVCFETISFGSRKKLF